MKIAKVDDFETGYVNKFRALASPFGLFLEHEKDRAALDLGMHFTQAKSDGSKIVTPAIAWFQLKGVMESTLSSDALSKLSEVKVTIEVSHLRFWYFFPYPVFLAVYVEARDQFVVLDVKRWTIKKFGASIVKLKQQTVTVPVPLTHVLDDNGFNNIRKAAQVPHVAKVLKGSDKEAHLFIRDDHLLKAIATAENRKAEVRTTVVKYGSKTRTEVYFEQREEGETEWQEIRSHWEFMMPDLTEAFPYLDFEAFDEENLVGRMDEHGRVERSDVLWYDEDESLDFDELLVLNDGRIFSGKGSFERTEIVLRPSLNAVGVEWAEVLEILENADVIAVDETPSFLSII